MSTMLGSGAARPPRHADRVGPPAARPDPRAGQGDPRPRRRRRARAADRDPDRDGPPRRPRAGPCRAAAARRHRRSASPRTEVTLERLCALVTPGAAEAVRARSAELRGLLAEIAREHGINRALMRQELAFLSHLTRLLGGDAEPGYKPDRRRRHRAGLPPRPRPAGVSDADLLLLRPPDLAPRAARAAAQPGRHRPQHRQRQHRGLLAPGGGARRHAGAVPARRRHAERLREPRLGRRRPELPPRARPVPRPPVPRPGVQPRPVERPRRHAAAGRGRARRARRQRHQHAARRVLGRLVRPRQLPEPGQRPGRAPGAGRARAGRRPTRSARSTTRSRPSRSRRRPSTTRSSRPPARATRAARSPRSPARSPQLNETIKRQKAGGDSPNDLLDQRDQLLDQLSSFGQISVESLDSGAVNVSFVDTASPGTTYSVVADSAATWAGPPAGDAWSPGGRAGGLLEAVRPGGTLDSYLSSLDSSPPR